ncbi:MAG TPA: response regulator [Alphaproteobacteria bacterium]|jgi:two-component system cell cycle response regulator CpdR|nr:response regulator [Alphaproteobacteria bacterium]
MATILLAEDDQSMRRFLKRALEKAGHEVLAVGDGLEALEAFEPGRFNLLLADIVMPGMDGIELARRARDTCPELPVMFITGFAAVALRARKTLPGETRVLAKPFHLRDLVAEIEKLLAA